MELECCNVLSAISARPTNYGGRWMWNPV